MAAEHGEAGAIVENENHQEAEDDASTSPGAASSSGPWSADEIAAIATAHAERLTKEHKKLQDDRKTAAEAKKVLTRQIRNQKKRVARLKSRARNLQNADLMDLIAMNELVKTAAKAKAKGKAKARATAVP